MVRQRPVQLVASCADEPIVIHVRDAAQPAITRHRRRSVGCPGLPNRGVLPAFVDTSENLVAKYLTNTIDHGGNFSVKIQSRLRNATTSPRLGHLNQRVDLSIAQPLSGWRGRGATVSPPRRTVTVTPCDHFEWHPPHINTLTGSLSARIRDS